MYGCKFYKKFILKNKNVINVFKRLNNIGILQTVLTKTWIELTEIRNTELLKLNKYQHENWEEISKFENKGKKATGMYCL